MRIATTARLHAFAALLLLLICCFCIRTTSAMEHGKFQKCAQKPFCARQRETNKPNTNKTTYTISSGTLQFNTAGANPAVLADLQDSRNKYDPLKLEVNALEHGIFRLRIREQITENTDESHKGKKRYEVQDVIMPEVKPTSFSKKNDSTITSETAPRGTTSELQIENDPASQHFRVNLIVNGKKTVALNSRDLLSYERIYRRKQQQQQQQESQEAAAPTAAGEEAKSPEEGQQLKQLQQQQQQEEEEEGESAIAMDIHFVGAKYLYGIPERTTDFALKPTRGEGISSEPYRIYNLDIFEYELHNPIGLYGIIPLMIGTDAATQTTGVFWLNAAESFVDVSNVKGASGDVVSQQAHWISESGIIDVFLLPGPTPKDILRQYAYLTGKPFMPQLFSLGYHQCRWNYKDEADVHAVDEGFDQHDIPYDVIWLDIEHTDGKRYFTWDPHHFPTPLEMQKKIEAKGRKMVTISDPHIKRASGYFVHDEAQSKGYYVKNANGGDFEGWCWPGSSSWLDFTNPQVRDWYAGLFSFDTYKGSSKILYTWIDMNEPSVFNGPEVTMDKTAVHYGDVPHRDVHNIYGFYHGMAAFQGHLKRRNGEDRPFILSRSFFAGSQRYVSVWTGDNAAKWEHLERSVPMLLSMSVSGLPFVGADVGGFFGNPEPDLLVRWYQAAAYTPFFRGHAHLEANRREPWLFGEENTKLIRKAITSRYAIMPYLYTVFFYAAQTGIPVMRPLFMEYPTDQNAYPIQDTFLLGSDLLIKPVTSKGQTTTTVYVPGNETWYDFEKGHAIALNRDRTVTLQTPLDTIAVLQRGGSIIPKRERVRRSTTQMANDPFTLVVAPDSNGRAEGFLYIDDGQSFAYKKGQFVLRRFAFDKNVLTIGDVGSDFLAGGGDLAHVNTGLTAKGFEPASHLRVERIVILGAAEKPTKIYLTESNGETNVVPTTAAVAPTTTTTTTRMVLDFEYDTVAKKVVIRKPLAAIAGAEWKIVVEH